MESLIQPQKFEMIKEADPNIEFMNKIELKKPFYFLKHPNFQYNHQIDPSEEFERLANQMNWIGKKEYFLEKQNLLNNLWIPGYDYFIKHPNFEYNRQSDPNTEFERLAKQMNWVGNQNYNHEKQNFLNYMQDPNYSLNKKKNKPKPKKEEKKPINIVKDNIPIKISKEPRLLIKETFDNIPPKENLSIEPIKLTPKDYFEYYEKNYKFNCDPTIKLSTRKKFDLLAEFMDWKDEVLKRNLKKFSAVLHRYILKNDSEEINIKSLCPFQLQKVHPLKESKEKQKDKQPKLTDKDYFNFYQKTYNFDFIPRNKRKEEFDKLANFMDWKDGLYERNKNHFSKFLRRFINKEVSEELNNRKFEINQNNKKKLIMPKTIPSKNLNEEHEEHEKHEKHEEHEKPKNFNNQNRKKKKFDRLVDFMNWKEELSKSNKKHFETLQHQNIFKDESEEVNNRKFEIKQKNYECYPNQEKNPNINELDNNINDLDQFENMAIQTNCNDEEYHRKKAEFNQFFLNNKKIAAISKNNQIINGYPNFRGNNEVHFNISSSNPAPPIMKVESDDDFSEEEKKENITKENNKTDMRNIENSSNSLNSSNLSISNPAELDSEDSESDEERKTNYIDK